MTQLVKKTLLEDKPDYEDPTENVAKLTEKEMAELGIKSCRQTGKCNCRCKNKKC